MFFTEYKVKAADTATSNTNTPSLADVIRDCPYGILHVTDHSTGNKMAVLVRLSYSELGGLALKVTHNYKVLIENLCGEQVSLKLCNREKNIYVVADVIISRVCNNGYFNKLFLKASVTRFNLFKKNKWHQMIASNSPA